MFVYFYGKIVDKRAYLPAYLSSSAVSAYLRIIKIKVSKQQNKKKQTTLRDQEFSCRLHQNYVNKVRGKEQRNWCHSSSCLHCINPNMVFSDIKM